VTGAEVPEAETSLDPADWEAFRRLAHEAVDDAVDYLRSVRERPVWRPMPAADKAALAAPLPVHARPLESVYREFHERILPFAVGNTHPRFFGWVHGAGLASGIVAELMSAAMNVNCGGRDHCGLHLERVVIDWCRSIFGFPAGASGVLVSGTSMANLIGLAVARNAGAAGDTRLDGLQGRTATLVAYASEEAHESVAKALEMLGVGRANLRRLPVNAAFEMETAALGEAIRDDRRAGRTPFCVIGSAGTVNTGAIDDIEALAEICRAEGLWLHVDGAFGALAVLSEGERTRLAGLERADSLAFDFHKWAHVAYDAGCLLVRDGRQHLEAFSTPAAYLGRTGRGLSGGGTWPCDLGPELSRGFRALRIWFALQEHGVQALGGAISRNCEQVRYLAGLLHRTPHVRVVSPPSLSIVCFRFEPPGWSLSDCDRLNADVVADLQESGVAAPSTTRVRGAGAIRVNVTNHRTTHADLDVLVAAACRAAAARSDLEAPRETSGQP
jgi:glutamate/tyrosine decarboxylase-like PLP-dependent enzyme